MIRIAIIFIFCINYQEKVILKADNYSRKYKLLFCGYLPFSKFFVDGIFKLIVWEGLTDEM